MSRPPFLRAFAGAAALAAISTGTARAYELIGSSWPNGDIVMHLQLGAPGSALLDGATDWAAVAESALNEWNQQMSRSKFTVLRDSTAAVARGNRINNVVFRADVYGSEFDARTLAVTLGSTSTTTGRSTEKDVVFNSNRTWNSYRGTLRSGTSEFRRVALHEFGHVLGLDHPDEAEPVQRVTAVMNSTISGIETLQPDDISGARILYDANSGVMPSITAQPQSKTVGVGESYTLSVGVNGGSEPLSYIWRFLPAGGRTLEAFRLATGPTYTIGSVQSADAGTYSVVVNSASGGFVASGNATLTVNPIATSTETALANISTRGIVTGGDNVLIAGIVIAGTSSKSVLVRAVGPALAGFGVLGALADPSLSIVGAQNQTIAQNDNWGTQTTGDATAIANASTRLGAFQFPTGSRDAALLVTLPPGSYTAIVSGTANSSGVALVEAYDADTDLAAAKTRKLVNIATRGLVNTGDNVLIAGLVVTGPGPRTYLIRAIGPTLLKAPFNIGNALLDPFLQIYKGETLLRENDDWDGSPSVQPALREASAKVGAFAMLETRDEALRSGLDSAMLITLQPGSYTAKVSGFQGVTGVALVEIYEMP